MPSEFDEIRPYEDGEIKEAFEGLLADRQFSKIMQGFVPWMPKIVRNGLLRLAFAGVDTPIQFKLRFMKPVVKYLIRKKTDGFTFDESELPRDKSLRYTFVSNHRDIVLDSALLDVALVEAGYPTTVEIGIGNNLLIYPWIERFVRMNKAFIVRRGLHPKEMLRSSQLMSRYIHHAVGDKKENIWIAQREGRAKDSDDRTQDSVLKMLAMGGNLRELNIVPLTISYEYDPCDYLKAVEFQQKRDNPAFKKSRQDDLDNMRIGIMGYKGRVAYYCGQPINEWIGDYEGLPRNEFFDAVAKRMDRIIHSNYRLYPCNYIALDCLNGSSDNISHYTAADKTSFEKYIEQQIGKATIKDKDEAFLRKMMLTMYANPLRNYMEATK